MNSIIQDRKECFFCGSQQNLECHHAIYGLSNRKWSERFGLTVWLCNRHHTGSNDSVHLNIAYDTKVKKAAQRAFEEKVGTREEFMNTFGRNYLWEEEDD